ncbi:sensor histidine kinase [Actinoplanes italicus]|uniref:histidine kinase n=1 Tax=Actinoplanes italicus TaxID=113567 RepID=A0A2T0K939_9ACTN|nr:ATP-binding protein [Actinoplanes italicus]PRX19577.1 signal transduction histidine kinase [Actinoplanes italicus]
MRLRALLPRLPGIRLRSALAAGAVVAVAAVAAGAVLLVTVRGILLDNATGTASGRVDQVVAALRAGSGPALSAALTPGEPGRTMVQVVDGAGRVVAASPGAGSRPMSGLRPPPGKPGRETARLPGREAARPAEETTRLRSGRHSSFRVLAAGVETRDGRYTVLVAQSLETLEEATRAIVAALLLGMPVLAVVVGVATFVFVGRTLRPVEAMTRRAATITATNLDARLPVPDSGDEIAALAATMNTMLDRIEAASAVQRRFVADASHELRSPLATIHANADLLTGAELDEPAERSATRIRRESTRLARLVDDLLLLARVDDAALRPRREEVDLDDLVYAARDRLAEDRPDLRVDGRVTPVRVMGDADQLHRVLRNLVDNAMRHARSRITVSLGASGGRAEIVVGNDGPAIGPEDQERIFDRFVRLDDSRSRQDGGTGLGLSIARDIAALHGGTLTVDDLPDGVAFRLRLPTPTDGSGLSSQS